MSVLFVLLGPISSSAVAVGTEDGRTDGAAATETAKAAPAEKDRAANPNTATAADAKSKTRPPSEQNETSTGGDSGPIFSEAVQDVLLDPLVFAPTRHPKRGITTRGVRPEEREAYYFVLDFVRKADQRLLKRAARELIQHRLKLPEYQRFREKPAEFPVYYDLFRHPEVYHGRPVTLRGHIRKLISYPADDNEYGIERLYEAWLFTPDSQTNPAVVVCTEIPEGIPTGGDIMVDGVSVTGYYFKNFGYTAQDKPRFAPMILAARLEWRPEQTAEAPLIPPALRNTLLVLALVVLLVLLYRYERRDEQQHAELHRRMLLQDESGTAVIPPEGSTAAPGSSPNRSTEGRESGDSAATPAEDSSPDRPAERPQGEDAADTSSAEDERPPAERQD